ncbi:hypothetical protein LEP1GSC052_2458 [Leptospira kmetyi serovar Malaysia str. Bejo-Iso9]|nr:hypothetical protein LEP1GSC052_2458 [Leptospira kmetyi serovar Malaysia str. Bejo-Iso9]
MYGSNDALHEIENNRRNKNAVRNIILFKRIRSNDSQYLFDRVVLLYPLVRIYKTIISKNRKSPSILCFGQRTAGFFLDRKNRIGINRVDSGTNDKNAMSH